MSGICYSFPLVVVVVFVEGLRISPHKLLVITLARLTELKLFGEIAILDLESWRVLTSTSIGFDPTTVLDYLPTNLILGHDRNIVTGVNGYIPTCHFLSLCLMFRWREIHHRRGGSFLPSPFITIPRLAGVCTFPAFFLACY